MGTIKVSIKVKDIFEAVNQLIETGKDTYQFEIDSKDIQIDDHQNKKYISVAMLDVQDRIGKRIE